MSGWPPQASQGLFACSNDVYVITSSACAKPALDVITTRVQEQCGIASNVAWLLHAAVRQHTGQPRLAQHPAR